MWLIVIGGVLLGGILGVFYLKDHLQKAWIARIAYHELTMRLTVVGVFLIALGVILTIGEVLEVLGWRDAGGAG